METCVEFTPTCREQMAGLAYMYDTGNFYLLVKTRDEEFGNQTLDLKKPAKLRLIKSDHFDVSRRGSRNLHSRRNTTVYLRVDDNPGRSVCEVFLLSGWKRV